MTACAMVVVALVVVAGTAFAITGGHNLQAQGNGDDRGGTCSGDSGGLVLLGDQSSNTIVAVASFSTNALSRGADYSYRIDRAEVLDWINSH